MSNDFTIRLNAIEYQNIDHRGQKRDYLIFNHYTQITCESYDSMQDSILARKANGETIEIPWSQIQMIYYPKKEADRDG